MYQLIEVKRKPQVRDNRIKVCKDSVKFSDNIHKVLSSDFVYVYIDYENKKMLWEGGADTRDAFKVRGFPPSYSKRAIYYNSIRRLGGRGSVICDKVKKGFYIGKVIDGNKIEFDIELGETPEVFKEGFTPYQHFISNINNENGGTNGGKKD